MRVELATFARASLEALGFDFRESDHCISIGEHGVSAVFLKRRLNGYFEMINRRHKSPGHWLRHEFGGDTMSAFVAMRDECIILHSEWMLCARENSLRLYPGLTRDEYQDSVDSMYQDSGFGLIWLNGDEEYARYEDADRGAASAEAGLKAFLSRNGWA